MRILFFNIHMIGFQGLADHVMPLGYDESAVPVAGFLPFRDLFGFLRLHDVLERIILDIADDPLFRRTVAGRDISPGVDEEKSRSMRRKGL